MTHIRRDFAAVTQLVEYRTRNAVGRGSIPFGGFVYRPAALYECRRFLSLPESIIILLFTQEKCMPVTILTDNDGRLLINSGSEKDVLVPADGGVVPPPPPDPASGIDLITENVKLLMHFDSQDFSTMDERGHHLNQDGDPRQDSVCKFGVSGIKFSIPADVLYTNPLANNNSDFSLNNDFTVDGWFKWDQQPITDQHLIGCDDGTNTYWALCIKDTHLQFVVGGPGNAQLQIDSDFSPDFTTNGGVWYHFAVFRHNGQIDMHINGTRSMKINGSTLSAPHRYLSNIVNGTNLSIGNDTNISKPFHGYMDELRISNDVLQSWLAGNAFVPPTLPYRLI